MPYTVKISFADNNEYKQSFETLALAEEFFMATVIADCIQIIRQSEGNIFIQLLAPDDKCIKQFIGTIV